jgi:hypothetical protein
MKACQLTKTKFPQKKEILNCFSASNNLDFNKTPPAFYLSSNIDAARYWMLKKCNTNKNGEVNEGKEVNKTTIRKGNVGNKKKMNEGKGNDIPIGAILIFRLPDHKGFFKG